jgi:dTDP-4-dehydrorhamnose reductase
MKKIIVTGCNGQLGRAINKVYASETEVVLINTDVAELDITNETEVLRFIENEKPYAIINCAAYTAVDKCESEEKLGYKINAIGPKNLSLAANAVGAKMLHVSTDYVFDGKKDTPYVEEDPTGPMGAYGRTKLAGEEFVKEVADKYFIVRTAWLYGDGNNFVKTMLRLSETKAELGVVRDQFGSPTSADELAKAIKVLLDTEEYGIYHGTCEGRTNWAEFAKMIFELAQKETIIKGITTEEYPTPAHRPAYSVLDNKAFRERIGYTFPEWQDALKDYMKELK